MKLRKFEDYTIDRRNRAIYINFRGKEYGGNLNAGSNDRIDVFRAVGDPNTYYIYSENTRMPTVGLQVVERTRSGLDTVGEVFFQEWEVEDALGRRWEDRTALTNAKKLAQYAYNNNPRRRKNASLPSKDWQYLGKGSTGVTIYQSTDKSPYRFSWTLYGLKNGKWAFSGGLEQGQWSNDRKGYLLATALKKIAQYDEADGYSVDAYNEDYNNNPRRRNPKPLSPQIRIFALKAMPLQPRHIKMLQSIIDEDGSDHTPMIDLVLKKAKKNMIVKLTLQQAERLYEELATLVLMFGRYRDYDARQEGKAIDAFNDSYVRNLIGALSDDPSFARKRKRAETHPHYAADRAMRGKLKNPRKRNTQKAYRLNLTGAQIQALYDWHSGQGSIFYSVASRANRKGYVDLTLEEMEDLDNEIYRTIGYGNVMGQKGVARSLRAISAKIQPIIDSRR